MNANVTLKFVQKIDEGLLKKSCELIETDIAQLESNVIIHTLVAYYLFAQQDFNRLFQMLAKTKSHELLALKLISFVKINRVDMAEQTLKQMKQLDEDNCLTQLAQSWLSVSVFITALKEAMTLSFVVE